MAKIRISSGELIWVFHQELEAEAVSCCAGQPSVGAWKRERSPIQPAHAGS